MFDGELASLQAIEATKTIKVPKPIASLDMSKNGAILVMEHLDLSYSRNQALLGTQIAK